LEADYVNVVEDRPELSAENRLPLWLKLTHPAARSLRPRMQVLLNSESFGARSETSSSAIAERPHISLKAKTSLHIQRGKKPTSSNPHLNTADCSIWDGYVTIHAKQSYLGQLFSTLLFIFKCDPHLTQQISVI